ncbi:uncharacterized protein LOC143300728 [Babylonia areolata]|uniref:uncharacterized protein LOC143300728 n=1 Tax=Babylonia areolata TaxID=304850 RepID=UPI003FD2E4D2
MSAFSSRTGGYKAGVLLLFFTTALFLVGFGAPFWATTESRQDYYDLVYDQGLWMHCVTTEAHYGSARGCYLSGIGGFPGWFHAARVMEGLCTTGLIVACIYAVATNCCRSFPGPRSRVLEITAGASGILGFIGCMLYAGMMKKGPSYSDLSAVAILYSPQNHDAVFSWAFYLAAVGSSFVVIAAIVIAVSNKPVGVQPNTGGMVMTTATAQPQTYVIQPGNYPPQPYVAQPGYYPPAQAGYPAQ